MSKNRGHMHHGAQYQTNDSQGWVEGITALKDSDGATALLADDAANGVHTAGVRSQNLRAHAPHHPPAFATALRMLTWRDDARCA
jgi:hypothetical protein